MVTVTCYKNTGFNAVNIPETPAFLTGGTFDSITFDALDILQVEGLSEVRVNASYSQVRDIDYCMLYDGSIAAFYAVGTPRMTSTDVATLPLTYDAITSAGGPGHLTYLDGVTERHTVATDNMFQYTQTDEYMAPRNSLELTYGGMLFNSTDVVATPVESTLDLEKLGSQFDDSGNFTGTGITFTDENGNSVTTPYTETVSARTVYVIGDETTGPLSPNTRLYENNDSSYPLIKKAIAAVRCLSMESSIISQVAYPDQFISVQIGENGQYSFVRGKDQTAESGLNFSYTTVNNKRVLYGEFNKYGLITAAGERGEYLPEQIGDSTDTAPSVRSIADPRPDGKPYFRFSKYLGNTGDDYFYVSCVSGLEWQNVPLVYSKASGSYMDKITFDNTARQQYINYQQSGREGYTGVASKGGVLDQLKGVLGDTAMLASRGIMNLFSGGSSDIVQGISSAWDTRNIYTYDIGNENYINDVYTNAREKELQNYGISQSVVVPQVMFPFNANLIRDFVGNGVFVYRYRYSDSDITRIDKLLTMYGYKDTVPLTPILFSSRQYFDYVRANGVSVGGNFPMWQKSLIAEQLNAGVRVWHVKPDTSYYNSGNPINIT